MSRRSLISAEENLIRSQRRGVPNVRMWSEQETPPRVAWDGYEEEPQVQLQVDPAWMMVVGVDTELTVQLHANDALIGSRILIGWTWREIANIALSPAWTLLNRHEVGYLGVAWMTRLYDPNDRVVATWSPTGSPWYSNGSIAYAFPADTAFDIDIAGSGIDNPVVLHQPALPHKHRFRFLTGAGFYAWWEASDPPGLDHGSAGYLGVGSTSNGRINENPAAEGFPEFDPHRTLEPWSTIPWWSGTATHGTIGVAGRLHWIESHVYAKGS